MSHDVNRTTEYKYTVEDQLSELVVRNSVTGDQVTKWHYGTTLADSGVASKSLLRSKVYPDSDDTEEGGDGVDDVYDRVEVSYNRQGQIRGVLDQNETEHRFEYDGLGRLTHDRVTELGSGIDGAVRRLSRQYDRTGRVERVSSWSDAEAGLGSAVNEVLLRYNGFGQLTREYQSHDGQVGTAITPVVQYAYADGTSRHIRKLSTIYPGGRELAFSYGASGGADDKLGRVHEIQDASDDGQVLARYTRRGISATMRIEYPETGPSNPLELTYIKQSGESNGPAGDQYTGQDRFNRIIDIRWLRGDTTTHVDRIQYGFDRAANRLWRKNVVAGNDWDEFYSCDGLYQLPDRQRGTLNSGNTGLTGTPLDQEQFTYDPAGNWEEYVTSANGSTTLDQARTHNKANEITAIDASSSLIGHDASGNMTLFPKVGDWESGQTATWDAWNRLMKIEEDSVTIGAYAYDALTRRVWKESDEGDGVVRRHFYYSDQWQVMEERLDEDEFADRTFVWGLRYNDDLILRDRGTERLYATHDQWHVISTVGINGNATERFAYRAFGETRVLAPNFTPRTASTSGWETTYGAYRWDGEAELFAVRFRYLHPGLGRWLSRDPMERIMEATNLYTYMRSPVNSVDPLGLITKEEGAKELEQLYPMLAQLCQECCLKDKDDCDSEARNIAEAVKKVWNDRFGGPLDNPGITVGGWLCFHWARGFDRAVDRLGPQIFNSDYCGLIDPESKAVHFYIEICVKKAARSSAMTSSYFSHKCCVVVDDGYCTGSLLHKDTKDFPWWKSARGRDGRPCFTKPWEKMESVTPETPKLNLSWGDAWK